jgi:hypothetical protein
MKRTFAAVITAVTAGTSMGLAPAVGAVAAPSARTPSAPSATLHVTPGWTYRDGGKIAVVATCSERGDLGIVNSAMMRYSVTLPKGWNLLIKVANKTNPGKYAITLWCVNSHHQVDAIDVRQVKIYQRLASFKQPPQPGLPKHFKANVTVTAGPPDPPPKPPKKKK